MLITGFGPFPGVSENPSAQLIEAIRDGHLRPPPGLAIATAVLPTDWEEVLTLTPQLYARHRPDAALHFGVAQESRGFRIEKLARNKTQQQPDIQGNLPPGSRIRTCSPHTLRGSMKAESVVLRLRALELPAAISSDAGSYLCNMQYYLSLAERQCRSPLRQALFVHIPAVPTTLEMQQVLTGAGAIIRACAAQLRGEVRP